MLFQVRLSSVEIMIYMVLVCVMVNHGADSEVVAMLFCDIAKMVLVQKKMLRYGSVLGFNMVQIVRLL